jgi:DNA invertase Pin-like site-specific DNA recombinase
MGENHDCARHEVEEVGIKSLAEPFLDTTSDFAEIIFAILGVAAKLKRRCILERTARGRADAKERGVKFGRKPISRRKHGREWRRARHSVALPVATTSVRQRFHD